MAEKSKKGRGVPAYVVGDEEVEAAEEAEKPIPIERK